MVYTTIIDFGGGAVKKLGEKETHKKWLNTMRTVKIYNRALVMDGYFVTLKIKVNVEGGSLNLSERLELERELNAKNFN